jgi:lipid A 3-O-deacylase
VGLATIALRALLAAVAGVAVFAAQPAAAQLALGSPGDLPRLQFGAGAFDVTPDVNHHDAAPAGDFSAEYHFGDLIWVFSPFVGLEVTTAGATYAYTGVGVDLYLAPNWVFTPDGAVGAFQNGTGTRLGSWVEFRTGGEFAYKFDDQSRLGLSVHHMSNGGLTHWNPGEQSVLIVYSIPLRW